MQNKILWGKSIFVGHSAPRVFEENHTVWIADLKRSESDMKQFSIPAILMIAVWLTPGCASHYAPAPKPEPARAPVAPAAPTLPARTNFHTMTIGLCEEYPAQSRSLDATRRDFEFLQTNGIHELRVCLPWREIEPKKRKYDWTFWDDFVHMAADEYDVHLIPYVCYTPLWASSSTNADYWQQPPKDEDQFADFMRHLVSRYGSRIHSWEIWNEPDNPYYWRGSVEQFADLLRAGSQVVHGADPTAKAVTGGLAWNMDFLEALLVNPAISNMDVINLHNYNETWVSDPLEKIPDSVGRVSDLIHQHGQRQEIWLGEVGYSDFHRGSFVSGQYTAHFADEHTPEAQAASLFRVMTLAASSGKVSLTAWYRIHDLPWEPTDIGDQNSSCLGLLDTNNAAKPALHALQFFNSLFPHGFNCIDSQVRVSKLIGSSAEVHAFARPDGSVIVAAWLRTYVPGRRAPSSYGETFTGAVALPIVPDSRSTTIDLEIPFALGTSAACFDNLGNHVSDVPISLTTGGSRIANLSIKDSTITVLELRSAAAKP